MPLIFLRAYVLLRFWSLANDDLEFEYCFCTVFGVPRLHPFFATPNSLLVYRQCLSLRRALCAGRNCFGLLGTRRYCLDVPRFFSQRALLPLRVAQCQAPLIFFVSLAVPRSRVTLFFFLFLIRSFPSGVEAGPRGPVKRFLVVVD